jgi:succinyl-diaminopimelate desuccinylase
MNGISMGPEASGVDPMALDVVELTRELIRIDSINPDLVPGAAGEAEIAKWCAAWLSTLGFAVQQVGSAERPSIIGIARGTGGGKSLMLNGHLDTVGVAGYDGDPFSAEVREGNVYGRGAFDTKAGVAAIMVAAARVATAKLAGDVIVTLVSDEEFSSQGTQDVLAAITADAVIISEPSEMHLVVAHRGFAWFEIELTGLAAHGSMPQQGVDAIVHAGFVTRALDDLGSRLESAPPHPQLGHSAVRVSMISGGTDAATVADSCTLTIERRMLPGEIPDSVEAELRDLLDILAAAHADFQFELRRLVARGAFEADANGPIVRAVADSAERVLGRPAALRGEPFWTDAGLILEAGIPCLLIGVDGGGAHAATEWVTVESIEQLTDVLEGASRTFCS